MGAELKVTSLILFLGAALLPSMVAANEVECFGEGGRWCGKTASLSRPEVIWSVSHKAHLPALILEITLHSLSGRAGLAVRVEPVPDSERPRILVSMREPDETYADWEDFEGPLASFQDGTALFVLPRPALEAFLMSSDDAHLYVFIELSAPSTNHKTSYKVSLDGLERALRFARLGK